MAASVTIKEIKNGFTVELFDTEGPSSLDNTVFVESFSKAIAAIVEWRNKEQSALEEQEKEAS